MSGPESSGPARARIIATALARTAAHHRKTALLGALIALGACALAAVAGRPLAKGVALLIAVAFAAAAYRSQRRAVRYLQPEGSPVLQAITKRPADIKTITYDRDRSLVLIVDVTGAELAVRVDADTPAAPLVDALARHAPEAARVEQ